MVKQCSAGRWALAVASRTFSLVARTASPVCLLSLVVNMLLTLANLRQKDHSVTSLAVLTNYVISMKPVNRNQPKMPTDRSTRTSLKCRPTGQPEQPTRTTYRFAHVCADERPQKHVRSDLLPFCIEFGGIPV